MPLPIFELIIFVPFVSFVAQTNQQEIGCDETLPERKGRNCAGRCVIERRCAAMTRSARVYLLAKKQRTENGGWWHSRQRRRPMPQLAFSLRSLRSLHEQILATPSLAGRTLLSASILSTIMLKTIEQHLKTGQQVGVLSTTIDILSGNQRFVN